MVELALCKQNFIRLKISILYSWQFFSSTFNLAETRVRSLEKIFSVITMSLNERYKPVQRYDWEEGNWCMFLGNLTRCQSKVSIFQPHLRMMLRSKQWMMTNLYFCCPQSHCKHTRFLTLLLRIISCVAVKWKYTSVSSNFRIATVVVILLYFRD